VGYKRPGVKVNDMRLNTVPEQEIISTAVKLYKISGEPVTATMVATRTKYSVQMVNKWLTKNQEMFTLELGARGQKFYTPREFML
jgi:hypothetical protein